MPVSIAQSQSQICDQMTHKDKYFASWRRCEFDDYRLLLELNCILLGEQWIKKRGGCETSGFWFNSIFTTMDKLELLTSKVCVFRRYVITVIKATNKMYLYLHTVDIVCDKHGSLEVIYHRL